MAYFIGSMPVGVHVAVGYDGRVVIADTERMSASPMIRLPYYVSNPIAIVGGQPYIAIKSIRICEECNVSRARSGKRRCQECKDSEKTKKAADKAKKARESTLDSTRSTPIVQPVQLKSSTRRDLNCYLCQMDACRFHQ